MNFRIKEARERKGLSQKELALSLGIKPTTFNGYEKGTHDPKSEILTMIAKKCDTTVDYLLGLTDNPEKAKSQNYGIERTDSKKEQLVHNYECMNETAQNTLVKYSEFMASQPENRKNNTEINKINA